GRSGAMGWCISPGWYARTGDADDAGAEQNGSICLPRDMTGQERYREPRTQGRPQPSCGPHRSNRRPGMVAGSRRRRWRALTGAAIDMKRVVIVMGVTALGKTTVA